MQIEQKQWTSEGQWQASGGNGVSESANLVLAFGSRSALSDSARFDEIKGFYPNAHILLGTTSGEILGIEVSDDTIALTAIQFESTTLKTASLRISEQQNSFEAGKTLASELLADDLVHVFVLSDGLQVNGSELVKGMSEALPSSISVTGGLAGDAANFEKTLVGLDSAPTDGNIVGIGLYGSSLKVGHGTQGGWDPFGPERIVTKSVSNVLYELDGQSALELYKTYLGDKASELPGSGLLFPLAIKESADSKAVVRTLLAVDEGEQSMTFAGDLPEGAVVQLMKANFDKLIDASAEAAESTLEKIGSDAQLAILVSCVGRKLVLDQRIEEEVEEVQAVLGDDIKITGFYSYGEISPLNDGYSCDLHNQTMTITTFREN
ncbi:MAG: FIST C-terminal domain-containing protein [Flavobacteriales bacterium]|nr:FIST C-terminal domain-containing protein [Flavobacteriales bacterium]